VSHSGRKCVLMPQPAIRHLDGGGDHREMMGVEVRIADISLVVLQLADGR